MRRDFLLGAGPLLALVLCACGPAAPAAPPPTLTQSSDQQATAFFQTLNAPTPTSTLSATSSGPTDTPLPSATPPSVATTAPTQPPLPAAPTGVGGCTLMVSFVSDVTVPDGTQMNPGQKFTKVWQLQNIGTCAWTTDYKVVFDMGTSMKADLSQSLSHPAAPGATITIAIAMTAPEQAGSYKGDWLLSDPQGTRFGTDLSGKVPFWVQIVVGTTPTPSPSATP